MSGIPETGITAFAFPGVGVEFCGCEAGFLHRHTRLVSPFLQEASAAARQDLGAAIAVGSASSLGGLANEILTYAFDCAAAAVFQDAGIHPGLVAGHSLGIYAAVMIAGAVSFTDGLRMVMEAHRLVDAISSDGEFGMAAVVGLTDRDIGSILVPGKYPSVCMVNSNNPASKIFAGRARELRPFLRAAESLEAIKAALLPVRGPYHHPELLRQVSSEFGVFLESVTWAAAGCPVVSSIDQALLVSSRDLLNLVATNLSSPIHWQSVVETFAREGVDTVLECGPGISLTQNARFIAGSPRHVNIKTSRRRLGV